MSGIYCDECGYNRTNQDCACPVATIQEPTCVGCHTPYDSRIDGLEFCSTVCFIQARGQFIKRPWYERVYDWLDGLLN